MNILQGTVALVTGANSGIGKATALGLAKLGATVIMVCRDRQKGEAARAEIMSESGNESVQLLLADLASQASIRQMADEFKSRYSRLDVLVNNAGLFVNERTLTEDGIETTFAVNHLAPFLLTNLLLETLLASSAARIINVASSAHTRSLDFGNLQGEKSFSSFHIYSQSKLMNILFTFELARRLEGTGVTANCVHPGVVKSGLQRDLLWFFQIVRQFFTSPEKGAETILYLAASADVQGTSGKYYADKLESTAATIAYDRDIQQHLWGNSAELVHWAEPLEASWV